MCVVKPYEIAEAFMEQHGRGIPLPELQKTFERSLQELGFRYFACCTHGDPLSARNAALVFQTYPQEWVRHYSESGHYRIDPVFRYADERMLPFHWDDVEFRTSLTNAQREILLQAQRHGIAHGFTVPIHPPGMQTASCSVVPDSGAIDRYSYQAVFTMACFMFDEMLQRSARAEGSGTRSVQLSERERQCLELAAQGKDDWSIGSLLRISERTAHNHIERAKRRLGVCTRVQVIVHALNEGQISFGDVIKAETRRNA
jgi:LuxR family transcriptional regulator, quorum-sensing system regulator CciR